MRLPIGKKSILFFRLGDGTTVIKMECMLTKLYFICLHLVAGCPPFWQEDFQSMDNMKEFAKHMSEFVKTRVSSDGTYLKMAQKRINGTCKSDIGLGVSTKRKEHVPSEVKETFYDALRSLYPEVSNEESSSPELRDKFHTVYQQVKKYRAEKTYFPSGHGVWDKPHDFFIRKPKGTTRRG